MGSDLFGAMRRLAMGPKNISSIDAEACKSLQALGLLELKHSAWTDPRGQRTTTAMLTPAGRAKLREIDTAGVKPSAIGTVAGRQLSDAALVALNALHQGRPPSQLEGQALVVAGLAVDHHGILSLTRRGSDLLATSAVRGRLESILSRHKRG